MRLFQTLCQNNIANAKKLIFSPNFTFQVYLQYAIVVYALEVIIAYIRDSNLFIFCGHDIRQNLNSAVNTNALPSSTSEIYLDQTGGIIIINTVFTRIKASLK